MTVALNKSNIISNDAGIIAFQSNIALEGATIMSTSPEGFGVVQAYIAREGVRQYQGYEVCSDLFRYDDIVGVLMPADELVKPEFLASIPHSTITVEHPYRGLVTVENWDEYGVGECSNDATIVDVDGEQRVLVTLWIKHKQAIAAIRAGKQELSMGFQHTWEIVSGVYTAENGGTTPYRAIQRNLVCNHVAIVEFGKAGSQCAISTDSKLPMKWHVFNKDRATNLESVEQSADSVNVPTNHKENNMTVETNKLVDLVLSKDNNTVAKVTSTDKLLIENHIAELNTAHDTAISTLKEAHETALNTANDSIATLTEEKDALTVANTAYAADAEKAEKATVLATVKSLGQSLDGVDAMSVKDIKLASLKVSNPNLEFAADASDEAINVAFTMSADSVTKVANDALAGKSLSTAKTSTSTDAATDACDQMQNPSSRSPKGA